VIQMFYMTDLSTGNFPKMESTERDKMQNINAGFLTMHIRNTQGFASCYNTGVWKHN